MPGGATYVTGLSEGRVTLDAVRAASQVNGASVSRGTRVAVSGYSQGGGAALWAGQVKDDYAPELNLTAVAAGGVPGNLPELFDSLAANPGNLHLRVMILLGLHHAYPDLPWSTLLTPLGKRRIAQLETKCTVDPGPPGVIGPDSTAAVFTGLELDDVFSTNPLTLDAWRSTALANSPGGSRPASPTLMYGSPADELVPYRIQREVLADYLRLGADVEWQTTVPLPHGATDLVWSPVVAAWITARFTEQRSGATP
ncbi:MAG TPA: lipase family protein [Umezawaea sp.]|nr:lipase family protein [Umezawaea sp.]